MHPLLTALCGIVCVLVFNAAGIVYLWFRAVSDGIEAEYHGE